MEQIFSLKQKSFVASDGVTICYYSSPISKSRITLLFIHGVGYDAQSWKEEQEALFNLDYQSISIDLRGHGLSGNPTEIESYSFARLAQDVVELIGKLNLKSVVLVGHSMGGMVAMYLAGTSHIEIAGLVLIETSCRVDFFGLPTIINQKLSHVLKAMAYALPSGYPKKHDSYDKFAGKDDLDVSRIASDITSTSLRSYLMACSKAASFDATELLKSIKIPALVIAGEKDTIIPVESAVDLAHRLPQGEYALIPDANHTVTTSNPENLSRIISRFAQEIKV